MHTILLICDVLFLDALLRDRNNDVDAAVELDGNVLRAFGEISVKAGFAN